jgi:transcriptional regulator with XRE-family HTH domain
MPASRKKKMKKKPEFSRRMEKLLRPGKTQAELAAQLETTPSRISEWLAGDKGEPTPEAYVRMGNLAQDRADKLWFWGKAGVARSEMLMVAGEELKSSPPKVLAGILAELPESSDIHEVRKQTCGAFSEGDVFLFDRADDDKDPRPFWNQPVLLMFDRTLLSTGRGSWIYHNTPDGLYAGRLRVKRDHTATGLSYVATAGHLNDVEENWSWHGTAVLLGRWNAPKDMSVKEARAAAFKELRLYSHVRLVGRVIAWFAAPKKGQS